MLKKNLRRLALPVLLACAIVAPCAIAQSNDVTPGTYILEGGSYTISLDRDGDGLVVHEPNKDSPYTRQADGSYHFYNPNTDTTYGIRVIDARTIEAFKPFDENNVASRLVLLGGGDTAASSEPPADSERYEAMADRYMTLSQTDTDNAQAWTACGAVAMKRSIATVAEGDAYAAQMAGMLKQMMSEGAGTPCEDAIPSSVW